MATGLIVMIPMILLYTLVPTGLLCILQYFLAK